MKLTPLKDFRHLLRWSFVFFDCMSSAPIQSTSMNRSNPSQSNYKSSLPPKHPSRGDVGGSGGGGGHGRRNVQEMDQGDSLDRMMMMV
jgi:hypothetical protein